MKKSRYHIKKVKSIIPLQYRMKFRDLLCGLTYWFYIGSRYQCPICSKHFRKLLPLGFYSPILKDLKVIGSGYYHLNVICPFCRSDERERLLYLFIKTKTGLLKTTKLNKLLHIAPERNLPQILKSNRNIRHISADLESPLVDVKMDITNIPFREKTFDIIICCHVLEHIPKDKKAMSELYRVLKLRGWAILQTPISPVLNKTLEDPRVTKPREREKLFGQCDHVRIYGKDYKNRLESVGFKVKIVDFAKKLDQKVVEKYCLNKDESIYFCTNKLT